jgi:hypothetical protein
MADNPTKVTTALGALNAASEWLQLRDEQLKTFQVRVSGVFVGTVTIQAKRPNEAAGAATPIGTLNAPNMNVGHLDGEWDVRAVMTAFTSGAANVELSS